jgi:hypothetical protein
MLVPVGALRRMLLAIACLRHLQQRPGSDLPQLRAGVLQWLTSPGLTEQHCRSLGGGIAPGLDAPGYR